MVISPRNANETAADYALRIIKANIISLDLEPGSPVSENELSDALGISRTPVREALIELSKVRIIESIPQKKTYVAPVNYSLVEEARFMRWTMEKAVIEIASENLSQSVIVTLTGNVAMQKYCLENGLKSELLELDNDFHRTFFEVTGNIEIYSLMQNLAIHFDRIRSMSINTIPDLKIVQDHEAILNAVTVHDKEKAVTLVQEHLTRYRYDDAAIRKKYPQYFA